MPFDALEFDEAMATIDLGYDLAFLLMDLDQRVGRSAANHVLNRYVARTGDAALTRGLSVFLSLRAMIRAHVQAKREHVDEANRYLSAAARYLTSPAPIVIAIGGLPGTGKSTLARALAPEVGGAPGALVLRSDEIRKRTHGVAPEQRLPQSAYSGTTSEAVLSTLTDLAHDTAAGGIRGDSRCHVHRSAPPRQNRNSGPERRRPVRRLVAASAPALARGTHCRPKERRVGCHGRSAAFSQP